MPTLTPNAGSARLLPSPPFRASRLYFSAFVTAAAVALAIFSPPLRADDAAPRKTLAELREAAKSEAPQALLDLADELAYGEDTTSEQQAESISWYRRAAEKGSAEAQNHLGVLLFMGEGVEKDHDQANQWFRRAAEQGHADSQFWLGGSYEMGDGLPADPAEAVRWYRRAAEQGHPVAQSSLGQMYASGSGVPKDDAEAVRWYRKAADQHSPSGEYSLAEMYAAGRGIAKDEKQAFLLYQSAAEKNYAVAMTALGQAYQLGQGIERNPVCAYFWYGVAKESGFSIGDEQREAQGERLSDAERAEGDRLIAATQVRDGVVQHPLCPGELISIDLKSSGLGELLAALELMSGRKILGVEPKIAALGITLKVDDVSWETALTRALDGAGYAWKREGEAIRIFAKPKKG